MTDTLMPEPALVEERHLLKVYASGNLGSVLIGV